MSESSDPFSVDLAGQVLEGTYGRFEIHEKLDEGGLGTVYTATQTSLGRKVIVKVPHVRFLGEPGFRERFAREIKQLIGLEHPHIVSIVTQGEHQRVPFFVLQYLAGGSLSSRLRGATGGRQTVAEVMAWLPDVAKALEFVHDNGVVHRDVKPANILFDKAGNVFLSDFGIAKALGDGGADATNLTGTGSGIGSPPYMSPEQGLGREIDATADQYALAATVYEALGGRPPFEGGTPMEVVMRKALSPPPDLASQMPTLPSGVCAAVMQGLEIKPELRHGGCLAFVEAIRAGLASKPAVASAATEPGGKATGRTRTIPRGGSPVGSGREPSTGVEQRERQAGARAPKQRRSKRTLLLMMLVLLGGTAAGLHFGGVVDLGGQGESGPASQDGPEIAKSGGDETPDPTPRDTAAPVLSVSSPGGSQESISAATYVVRGTVQDEALASLTVDGTVVVPEASGAFRHEVTVAPGKTRSFHIVAVDKAGNETTRGPYEVTRERDKVTYRITLLAPKSGSLLNTRTLEVRGRVDPAPETPEARADLVLRVNGKRAEVLADGTFDVTLTAAGDGQFAIKVELSGARHVNPAEVRRSVTIDTQAPMLSVTHPGTATHAMAERTIEFRGVVNDASKVTVFAGSTPISPTRSGAWRWNTDLTVGQTRQVKFHAVDAAGNRSAEITRSVTRRKPVAQVPSWAKVSKAQTDEAKRLGIPVAIENKFGMRFVLIPAGTFQMGSTAAERAQLLREDSYAKAEYFSDEHQHSVRLTKAYYMSIHELTNAEYRRFKSSHDSETYENHSLNGASQPVVNVSHEDVVGYAKWLSGQESGRTYRLPTEAEWERACRGGTTSRHSWGTSNALGPKFANANDPLTKKEFEFSWDGWPTDDGQRVGAPVGSYRPNPFGLYDMHGNVYEWCADWRGKDYYQASSAGVDPAGPSAGTSRVLRGGSWNDIPRNVRCAFRSRYVPSIRHDNSGCRLVFSAR